MISNDFDSSKFRYFRLLKETDDYSSSFLVFPDLKKNMIFKISEDELYKNIFSDTFYRMIEKHLETFDVKRLSNEERFDVIKFLTLQDDLIIDADYQTKFYFETGSFCIVDAWLKNKMNDEGLYNKTWFSDPKSLAQRNAEVFNMVDDEEKISNEIIKSQSLTLWSNPSLIKLKEIEIFKFKVNTPIHFNLKRGEVLNLANPVIALALINQDYLKLLANSGEIMGIEKDNHFCEDFKDFIPGTLRKYYKVKDDIKIKDFLDITGEFRFNNFRCGYNAFLVSGYGRADFCKYNKENYRNDGTIGYFYVDYRAGISDSVVENEILKIAVCLSQEDAILRYNMDIEAKKRYELELQALEYVKNHKSKYYKGTNRLLTPVEFMQQEEAKERKGLGMRLVRGLNKRIDDMQQ